ncbi:hypothetical protein GOFOIKOB_4839 [Methylobacterium tardum]|uniref:Uncharacterized protein n=1 Tax=Methylobacterium tardum TaxID=374432 RepID=A0AA37TC12_9HYPH|nr:hypothetical protein [Methylobacterium tardum]URD37308.1 hypothetical protein M6G65_01510 [Methylobacterium tardum]GJE51777.1 hypothetical protein GOFOIKOB_4839 [Methylobacterium tardum]GLS70806.1 hypothetical protein GCM10007890_28190 [Methylobacterium tardum]
MADCDDPTGIPDRKSVLTSRSWGGRIAGQADEFRADATSDEAVPYRFRIDPKDGVGAGAWSGRVFVENFEITKANNGTVNFTSQFRGDGPLAWGPWTCAGLRPAAPW